MKNRSPTGIWNVGFLSNIRNRRVSVRRHQQPVILNLPKRALPDEHAAQYLETEKNDNI